MTLYWVHLNAKRGVGGGEGGQTNGSEIFQSTDWHLPQCCVQLFMHTHTRCMKWCLLRAVLQWYDMIWYDTRLRRCFKRASQSVRQCEWRERSQVSVHSVDQLSAAAAAAGLYDISSCWRHVIMCIHSCCYILSALTLWIDACMCVYMHMRYHQYRPYNETKIVSKRHPKRVCITHWD